MKIGVIEIGGDVKVLWALACIVLNTTEEGTTHARIRLH